MADRRLGVEVSVVLFIGLLISLAMTGLVYFDLKSNQSLALIIVQRYEELESAIVNTSHPSLSGAPRGRAVSFPRNKNSLWLNNLGSSRGRTDRKSVV